MSVDTGTLGIANEFHMCFLTETFFLRNDDNDCKKKKKKKHEVIGNFKQLKVSLSFQTTTTTKN